MTDDQPNEKRIILESLDKMYEDLDTRFRIDQLEQKYNFMAPDQNVTEFQKGLSDYRQKILHVKKSIETGNEIDTKEKRDVVCAAIEGSEKELLHTLSIINKIPSDYMSKNLIEKLKHIDPLRKKYCDEEASLVDDVISHL